MSDNYESMTVVELRKTAKELGVRLPAGSNKQAIIDLIREKTGSAEGGAPVQTEMNVEESAPAAPAARKVRTASIITDDEDEDTPVLTVYSRPGPGRPASQSSPVPTPSPAPEKSSTLSSISSKAPAFTLEGSRSWHNPRSYQPSYSSPRPAQGGWNTSSRGYERPQGDRSYRSSSYTPPRPEPSYSARSQAPLPE